MIGFVREVIQMELAGADSPELPDLDILKQPGSCFVMLRDFSGELRGCIGNVETFETLGENLRRNAVNAAFMDPSFPPLEYEELGEITIEISVLSQPAAISGMEDFRLGSDGIILRKKERTAVFLPHIPVEQRWDVPTVFRYLARKAGLPEESWMDEDVNLFTFQTETFSEKTI